MLQIARGALKAAAFMVAVTIGKGAIYNVILDMAYPIICKIHHIAV